MRFHGDVIPSGTSRLVFPELAGYLKEAFSGLASIRVVVNRWGSVLGTGTRTMQSKDSQNGCIHDTACASYLSCAQSSLEIVHWKFYFESTCFPLKP